MKKALCLVVAIVLVAMLAACESRPQRLAREAREANEQLRQTMDNVSVINRAINLMERGQALPDHDNRKARALAVLQSAINSIEREDFAAASHHLDRAEAILDGR